MDNGLFLWFFRTTGFQFFFVYQLKLKTFNTQTYCPWYLVERTIIVMRIMIGMKLVAIKMWSHRTTKTHIHPTNTLCYSIVLKIDNYPASKEYFHSNECKQKSKINIVSYFALLIRNQRTYFACCSTQRPYTILSLQFVLIL